MLTLNFYFMKHQFLFFALALLVLSSCSTQDDVGLIGSLNSSAIAIAESDKVSADDILAVASKFRNTENTRTRSNDYTTSILFDNNGNASIYVVNFNNNEGFILISATKRYCPVLAYSDKGHFDITSIAESGIEVWKEETMEAISVANIHPNDSIAKYRNLWKQYSNTSDNPQTKKHSKSARPKYTDPDMLSAQVILQDSVCSWIAKGYEIFSIADDEHIELVKGAIYPLYEDEWESLCIGVKKQFSKNESIPNFLETEWYQRDGFRQSYPIVNGEYARAGCGPVAAGQIMYYYKYPTRFNWDDMPLTYGTKTTSDFLLEIAKSADAKYTSEGTSTANNKVCKVFNNWGYTNAVVKNHNGSNAWKEIAQRHPVYMTGYDNNEKNAGHAWVCSGGQYFSGESYSEIYTFINRKEFTCLDRYDYSFFSATYFYMNWGWGSSGGNGYFLDSNITVSNYNFAKNRQDIYNIYPTK